MIFRYVDEVPSLMDTVKLFAVLYEIILPIEIFNCELHEAVIKLS